MFEKIIGNKRIQSELIKSIENKNVSHSYMFVGIEGIGKQLTAKEFAKGLLCISEAENCCNNCKSCIEFNSANNPDFLLVEPEGNSIKIEQIRYLQRKIQEKPIISEKKVYIINDAEKMTIEAQNCLLKTLEEPPEYAIIILIVSNDNAILSTIKSRCMKIVFKAIDSGLIKKFMEEHYEMTDISENLLEAFQGSIAKAIRLKEKQSEYKEIENVILNLEKKDIIDILKLSDIIYKSKEEIMEILDYINVILLKLAKENYKYSKCINIVEDTKVRLNQNANYDMSIDNMIFKMWEELN